MSHAQPPTVGLRTLLFSGFAVLIALLVTVAAVGLFQVRSLYGQVEGLTQSTVEFLIGAGKAQAWNNEIGISVRDIVNTSNVTAQKENMKRLNTAQKSFRDELTAMLKFAEAGGRPEQAELKKIMASFEQTKLVFDEIVNLVDEADFDAARDSIFKKLRPLQQDVSTQLNAFQERQNEQAKEASRQARERYSGALGIMVAFVLGGIVAGVAIALTIVRKVMAPLAEAADFAGRIAGGDLSARIESRGHDEVGRLLAALNEMAKQLAATVAEIRSVAGRVAGEAGELAGSANAAGERSQVQLDRVVEITAAIEQMSVSIASVSETTSGVESAAEEARQLTEDGNRNMQHSLDEMTQIVRHVDNSRTTIGELNEALKQINEITNVIKEIAGQTNLLALNAAIEAARAGEQGRGFAVVADEVRKLAERTQASTTEISDMLARIDERAAEAVAAMEQVRSSVDTGATDTRAVGDRLQQILQAAARVSELVRSIADSTREQSRGSEMTARSIEAVAGLSGETDATIRTVARTANDMQAVASELQTLVDKFRT